MRGEGTPWSRKTREREQGEKTYFGIDGKIFALGVGGEGNFGVIVIFEVVERGCPRVQRFVVIEVVGAGLLLLLLLLLLLPTKLKDVPLGRWGILEVGVYLKHHHHHHQHRHVIIAN